MNDIPVINHFGHVKNGETFFYDINSYISNLKLLEGKEFQLTIQEKFEEVTLDQHGYYRGGILPTMLQDEQFGGWNSDELHKFLVDKFLGYDIEKAIGEEFVTIRVIPSTANIGKKRMAKFVNDVINYAGSIGIIIKEPEYYQHNKYGKN